ncbi:dipeptidyl aminopeptidase B, partial [Lecanoromycetidae sp. Uapishka_2]
MYFLRDLERTISLHPSFFGPRVQEYLKNRLLEDVEGSCTGQYYIICVMDYFDITEGRVVPGSASAEYTLIPADIKYDANATPPQFTDNGDQVIEKGTHLRVKIIGMRSDVGSMFAIGSIKEDFLGYAKLVFRKSLGLLTSLKDIVTDLMASSPYHDDPERRPFNEGSSSPDLDRNSFDSITSSSDTSIALDRLDGDGNTIVNGHTKDPPRTKAKGDDYDEEDGFYVPPIRHALERRNRRIIWALGGLCFGGWLLALVLFLSRQTFKHASSIPFDPVATASHGSGKAVTLDQFLSGAWRPRKQPISWIAGANGEDGMLLEKGRAGKDYLIVEDIRSRVPGADARPSQTLMKSGQFSADGRQVNVGEVWPRRDLKKILVMSDKQGNWRHSSTGFYWIFDVESQQAEPLDPKMPNGRIQLASWSPQGDAIVFTRNNDMFLRKLASEDAEQITNDGGTELFYGVPDWVYEEEVFAGNSATWWSDDGKFIAFLRTNETIVPEYPIQYFVSRPSGTQPAEGEENYPEVRQIKYPKAGAPNPVVDIQFYDVEKGEVFTISTDSDFPDENRLITEVIWAGNEGKILVKNTNRESDILKVALLDVNERTGKIVRTVDVNKIDGGWFEVSETTKYIPADPNNERPHSGYIDTIIHEGYDHLAYFTPLDNPEPKMITSGEWEVINSPLAVDLVANLVYIMATKDSSIQRHAYTVNLDGTGFQHYTNTRKEGYYDVTLSTGNGFALINYEGPDIPWQEVRTTPSWGDHFYHHKFEENAEIAKMASAHELPIEIYQTINIDGIDLNIVERRPPHFDENKKYPVLFQLYGGPGSQMVNKKFGVDFQSYVASNLGYIVITFDGRGTGFLGRNARTLIRGHIGYIEGLDQITAAKMWAKKDYVDPERMAIWGWSYGGFMALKTLELDGGETFKYGMAVAPVTDWSFYDSIYTERYMHTPQNNEAGYLNTTISNTTALAGNVRFLMMHGVADDNVHLQNTLTLLDRLDLAGVENYDYHVFPDSDHSIYFHNANRMVYDRLNNWLVNAFNGEWLRTESAVPMEKIGADTQ